MGRTLWHWRNYRHRWCRRWLKSIQTSNGTQSWTWPNGSEISHVCGRNPIMSHAKIVRYARGQMSKRIRHSGPRIILETTKFSLRSTHNFGKSISDDEVSKGTKAIGTSSSHIAATKRWDRPHRSRWWGWGWYVVPRSRGRDMCRMGVVMIQRKRSSLSNMGNHTQ